VLLFGHIYLLIYSIRLISIVNISDICHHQEEITVSIFGHHDVILTGFVPFMRSLTTLEITSVYKVAVSIFGYNDVMLMLFVHFMGVISN
jgi:hypothetical protein